MKKVLFFIAIAIATVSFTGCESDEDCGYINGKPLNKGSQGGCYYINDNGNKTYVDRDQCKC